MSIWWKETLLDPSLINNSITLKFINSYDNNLILNKKSQLEIYSILPNDLKQSRRRQESIYLSKINNINIFLHPRFLPIICMDILSCNHIPIQILCILSADYRFSLLYYSPLSNSIEILWTKKLINIWYLNSISTPLIYSYNEYIGISLSNESKTLYIFKFNLNSLAYDKDKGLYFINNNNSELLYQQWEFTLEGCIKDFIFYNNPNILFRNKSKSIDRSDYSSLPNSPIVSSPRSPITTSPFLHSHTSPSPNYSNSSTRIDSPKDINIDIINQEDNLSIGVLISTNTDSKEWILKKLKLHSGLIKQDSSIQIFPETSKLLSASIGLLCFCDSEVIFFQNNKKKVFSLIIKGIPKFCSKIGDESYIIGDYYGNIIYCMMHFDKDKRNINRISQIPITQININISSISCIESIKRSNTKYGSFIVLIISKYDNSLISVINPDESKGNRYSNITCMKNLSSINQCHILSSSQNITNQNLCNEILTITPNEISLLQKKEPIHELASFKQSNITNIWTLSTVDSNKTNQMDNFDEFIVISEGNHSTHILSIPDNLAKTSFFRGFNDNQPSLFVGSISEPIAIQVIPTQVNVVNRYTGTLLSEWRASEYSLTSCPFTKACLVSGYLCILQNYSTIILLSCEKPTLGSANNRLPKINLQLESKKDLSDKITIWDSLSLSKSIILNCDNSNTNNKSDRDIQQEKTETSVTNPDSMVDIWEDICMEESMGSNNLPSLEEPKILNNLKVIGYIVCYLPHSHSILILSIPTFTIIANYSLSKDISPVYSLVIYPIDQINYSQLSIILGLKDGSIIGLNISITNKIEFQLDIQLHQQSRPLIKSKPAILHKLPNSFSPSSQKLILNVLISTNTNRILERTINSYTITPITIYEQMKCLCFFKESRIGNNIPLIFYASKNKLTLITSKWNIDESNINTNIKSLSLRITPLIDKSLNIYASCFCPKLNGIVILLKNNNNKFQLQYYDISLYCIKSTINILYDVSSCYKIFDYPLQDENIILVLSKIKQSYVLLIYSICNDKSFIYNTMIPTSKHVKIISIIGLLFCCTSDTIIGYTWNTKNKTMMKIIELALHNNTNNINKNEYFIKDQLYCSCVSLQRIANFIQDGKVKGTQFRLLISNILEKTYIIDFSVGQGESKIKIVGECILPRKRIISNSFSSVEGDYFIITDHIGVLSFYQCISNQTENNNNDKLNIQLLYSYYLGEVITSIKFIPYSCKLILGSSNGRIIILSRIQSQVLSLYQKLQDILKQYIPCIGSQFKEDIIKELHNNFKEMKNAQEQLFMQINNSPTNEGYNIISKDILKSELNIIEGDYLKLYITLLSNEKQIQIASNLSKSKDEILKILNTQIN